MAARSLPLTVSAVRPRVAWDALFVALAGVHAIVLLTAASIPVIAISLWWNANTIAHNFIHRPFFRGRWANRLFSILLSLVLGIPQSYWRARHLRHHAASHHHEAREGHEGQAGSPGRTRLTAAMAFEAGCILALWTALVLVDRRFFLFVYAPGYALGLGLCFLQGHYEHQGGTTSHYGWLYNTLFFNDGYHVEHHRRPHAHWTELRREVRPETRSSRWPAVLRWLDAAALGVLEWLERLVLRWPALQRFVIDRHERAFRRVLAEAGPVRRVTIVGGGLFPRTALILRRLLPDAALTIVEANAANLAIGRARLDDGVELIHESFEPGRRRDADLIVLPLAYKGDRQEIYRHPPASRVIVHDWIWARRATGVRVSWLLLKRLNLVRQ